jgi:hypothetical protein
VNRQDRRASMRQHETLTVKAIRIYFDNGQSVDLDTQKVMIIDKETKAQLFTEVLQEKA